jgi:hypothetical protein
LRGEVYGGVVSALRRRFPSGMTKKGGGKICFSFETQIPFGNDKKARDDKEKGRG